VAVEKDGPLMIFNFAQPSNALAEMAKRFTGNSTEIKDKQFLKVSSQIVVMLGGSTSEVNNEQP